MFWHLASHIRATDNNAIRKRLLRSNIHKRTKEQHKLKQICKIFRIYLEKKFSALDWYLLWKFARYNVQKVEKTTVETHEKKMRNLTKNQTLPFLPEDVIRNFSSYSLTEEESKLLMNGLNYGIPLPYIAKSNVFTTFEMIHRFTVTELKSEDLKADLKTDISYLAHQYYSSYKPTRNSLKKHSIMKQLQKKQKIIITRPDKGNGVVILNKDQYISSIKSLLNDELKFKKLLLIYARASGKGSSEN